MIKSIDSLKKEVMAESPEWCKERRIEYLRNLCNMCKYALKEAHKNYNEYLKDGLPKWFCEIVLELRKVKKWKKMLKRLNCELYDLNNGKSENGITQSMIDEAKQYPITQLLYFNKNNKAFCPFHNDKKNPNFHYYKKDNRAYCFNCGKSVDSISIAMKIYNYSFKEAVKFLCDNSSFNHE